MKLKILSLCVLVLLAFTVHAQEKKAASSITDKPVKKNTSPLECTKGCIGTEKIPSVTQAQRRDSSCYIDVKSAESLMKNSSLTVIDVRDKNEYALRNIPGAMNFPASDIKTKAFLKNAPLLVYSTGKYDPSLEVLCADLKRNGFKNVKILSGGIVSWIMQVEANSSSRESDLRRLARLSAHDLFIETQAEDKLIINLSSAFKGPDFKSEQILMESPLSIDALQSIVSKAVAKRPKNAIRRIVLVGLENTDSAALNTVLGNASFGLPIFVYTENIQSYETAMKTMQTMWKKQEKGATPQGCSFQ